MRVYVVAYHGYEGIEALLWAGADADEARAQVHSIRARCVRTAAVRESKRYDRLGYPWADFDDPDRVCVMCHIDGNAMLTCCCALLSVPASKLVLL